MGKYQKGKEKTRKEAIGWKTSGGVIMVNVIKDIVNRLDGTSYDDQGFAVTSSALTGGSFIELQVRPYIKHEGAEGLPEEEHLMEMTRRLLSQYSDGSRYTVLKAEKAVGLWGLLVKEVQEKTEDKADEV